MSRRTFVIQSVRIREDIIDVLKETAERPKFTTRQAVRISPYNEKGRVKNDLAKKSLPYLAHIGEVVSWTRYSTRSLSGIVYQVRMDDGKVLQLTEDCLMPVKDPV